jgi:hypothetical protein
MSSLAKKSIAYHQSDRFFANDLLQRNIPAAITFSTLYQGI